MSTAVMERHLISLAAERKAEILASGGIDKLRIALAEVRHQVTDALTTGLVDQVLHRPMRFPGFNLPLTAPRLGQ
jgi:hypothetical protein